MPLVTPSQFSQQDREVLKQGIITQFREWSGGRDTIAREKLTELLKPAANSSAAKNDQVASQSVDAMLQIIGKNGEIHLDDYLKLCGY